MSPKPDEPLLTVASRCLFIVRPPRILTIHLVRFSQAQGGYGLRKNGDPVAFPADLDLSGYCAPGTRPPRECAR